MLVPPSAHGAFVVNNKGTYFTGDLGVVIDREVYLNGGYERESIDLFLASVRPDRRGVILDVGCNAGTHSLQFAKAFSAVHAFDPNPALWEQFEANAALNGAGHISVSGLNGGATTMVLSGAGDLRPAVRWIRSPHASTVPATWTWGIWRPRTPPWRSMAPATCWCAQVASSPPG